MSKLPHVKSFRELLVYQKARQLAKDIFEISKSFPKEENFSLTNQVRRSSRSIGAQIAESWAKRKYIKHFISKPTDADCEQLETQHWIDTAGDCNYINHEQVIKLNLLCEEIGRLLFGMIDKANLFCNTQGK